MLTERFEHALRFAAQAHAKQSRKGCDVPYLAHLMSVAALVLEHGGGEDEAIAALLHDAVEDQGGAAMHARVLEAFGPGVAAIVEGCTEPGGIPRPPWLERKTRYIERIAGAPPAVRLVAASDKLHNARCVLTDFRARGAVSFERFTAGARGTIWFYRAVTDALRLDPIPAHQPLMDELERTVSELERLSGMDGRAAALTNDQP